MYNILFFKKHSTRFSLSFLIATKVSTVFRANRLIDFVIMRSILPLIVSWIICLNPSRFLVNVAICFVTIHLDKFHSGFALMKLSINRFGLHRKSFVHHFRLRLEHRLQPSLAHFIKRVNVNGLIVCGITVIFFIIFSFHYFCAFLSLLMSMIHWGFCASK